MSVRPYLFFGGNCREALAFYERVLDAEIVHTQRFANAPMKVDAAHADRVMHAEVLINETVVMASDGMPGTHPILGDQISLSLDLESEEVARRYFAGLAEGGEVLQPLKEQFWGALFGMVEDKYGFRWMLNCDLSEKDD